jgi:hypothetical protein
LWSETSNGDFELTYYTPNSTYDGGYWWFDLKVDHDGEGSFTDADGYSATWYNDGECTGVWEDSLGDETYIYPDGEEDDFYADGSWDIYYPDGSYEI